MKLKLAVYIKFDYNQLFSGESYNLFIEEFCLKSIDFS